MITSTRGSHRVVHNAAGVVVAQRVRIMVLLFDGGLFRRLAAAEEPHDVALRMPQQACLAVSGCRSGLETADLAVSGLRSGRSAPQQ
jgi:hypothetical protein